MTGSRNPSIRRLDRVSASFIGADTIRIYYRFDENLAVIGFTRSCRFHNRSNGFLLKVIRYHHLDTGSDGHRNHGIEAAKLGIADATNFSYRHPTNAYRSNCALNVLEAMGSDKANHANHLRFAWCTRSSKLDFLELE